MQLPVRQEIPADFTPWGVGDPPTRDNCDRSNPYHAYLWGLVDLPYKLFPKDYLQFVSQRLYDLFGPPNPDWVPQPAQPVKQMRKLTAFPTRDNCDRTNPHEAYVWGLVALPFQQGAPLLFGVDDLQVISQRLFELFGPPDPGWVPRLVYRLPGRGDVMTSPGVWVKGDRCDLS